VDGTTRNGGWQLEADLYRDRRAEVGLFPSADAGFNLVATNGNYTGTSANIAFEWRRRVTENSDLKVNSYYDFMSRPEPGGPKAETRTGDFEIQYHIAAPKGNDITGGVSDRVISVGGPATGLISMDPSQITYQVAGGFVQDEVHFAQDRLLLTFGVKLEHDSFAGWQPQPTARVLWAPTKRHSAWAAVSRASQTPSIYERYMTEDIYSVPASASTYGLPVFVTVSGSLIYQPSILMAYEVGFRAQVSPRLSVDIAGFYDCYQQLQSESLGTPSLVFGTQPYILQPVTFTNNLNAVVPGGEISAMYNPFSRWKLAASFSHLDVHEHTLGIASDEAFNPSQAATPRNNWKIQSFLNLSQAVQLDTLVFTSSAVLSPLYPTDVLVPPHTRLDLRLGWRVSPRLEVSVSGQDLLNPRHLELVPEAYTVARDAVRGYYLRTTWRF
jgi:iron complex outermembrane receptor protein